MIVIKDNKNYKKKEAELISTSDSSIPEYSVAQDSVGEPPVRTMVDKFTCEWRLQWYFDILETEEGPQAQ